jgi:hypothetical protein
MTSISTSTSTQCRKKCEWCWKETEASKFDPIIVLCSEKCWLSWRFYNSCAMVDEHNRIFKKSTDTIDDESISYDYRSASIR